MSVVKVSHPQGEYDIHIQPGLLADLGDRAAEFGLDGRVAVVCSEVVAPLYGEALASRLPNAVLVIISDGEANKTLATIEALYYDFVSAGLDRASTVIALGGGVTGDAVGFAAASYMRGVRLVQIPTTLLAMVDSSVGGKVGVDLPVGKNLVGAFKQPAVVLMDPEVLATLPERELRCGMAEVFKHGLIGDPELLQRALALHTPPNWLDDRSLNPRAYFSALADLLPAAVQVKIDLVQQDPYEHSVRAFLNLGHTFAHAIEQVSGYSWLHGEAVGAGLMAAAKLSLRLGLCSADVVEIVRQALRAAALPMRIGALEPEALWAAMSTDKKWRAGRSRFVLLEAVGRPRIVDGVAAADVLAVLEEMRGMDQ
jgi:3-dehydroquinate synthase